MAARWFTARAPFSGGFYRSLERLLNFRTDLFLFESTYAADLFRAKIDSPRGMVRVVRNGVSSAEFDPVVVQSDATDFVCIGELRPVKAIDILIEAIANPQAIGTSGDATVVGEGPDEAKLKAQVRERGLVDEVRFVGFQPARVAFSMGRMLVIPSRAEVLALRGAGSCRRRLAGHWHQGRRRTGNFRAGLPTASCLRTIFPRSSPLCAQAVDRSQRRRTASLSTSERASAPSFRWIEWSTAVLRLIVKRWRCESLLNSHNQFLKIVHYVAALRDP